MTDPGATLTLDTQISFESDAQRAQFTEELAASVSGLVARYSHPDAPRARPFRLAVIAHPSPGATAGSSW